MNHDHPSSMNVQDAQTESGVGRKPWRVPEIQDAPVACTERKTADIVEYTFGKNGS